MPLHVLIIGAGIAGLGAAIGLAREGHKVTVFEKSSFAQEVGAALHIGPQANLVLKEWGVDVSTMDPSQYDAFKTVSISEDHSKDFYHDIAAKRARLNVHSPHLLAHRQDLHNRLRAVAESSLGVAVRLSSQVIKVDPESATLTLADGSTHRGDFIVGADGMHSITVASVDKVTEVSSSRNMYRFMVPTDVALQKVPDTLKDWDYQTTMMDYHDFENGRYLIIYPCRGGKTLNMVTIQPDAMDNADFGDSWNTPGSLEDLEDILRGYPEKVLRLVSLAQDIKHWREVNRHCPRTFLQSRLLLIGDAAHPIKPYFAAGAATAIEDAGVLGALFRQVMDRPVDVDTRLKTYNCIRYARGVTVKYMSEPEDPQWDVPPQEKMDQLLSGVTPPQDMEEYLWTYDSFVEAEQALETI